MDIDLTTYIYSTMTQQEIIHSLLNVPNPPFPWDPLWLCFDEDLLPFQYVGPPEMSRENALQLILSQRVLAPSTEARARKALYPTQEDRAKDMTKSIIARVWAVIENNELDCMICMEKKPQMLTTKCGHITCHECWGQFVHMNHPDYHMECPMCRRFLWVDGVVELEVFTKVHGKVAQAGNSETEDGTEMKSLLD